MKITIEVECTPAEARQTMGLPDVEPLQTEIMEKVKERMLQALSLSDPETLYRTWLPLSQNLGAQGLEAFQNIVRFATQGRTKTSSGTEKPKSKS